MFFFFPSVPNSECFPLSSHKEPQGTLAVLMIEIEVQDLSWSPWHLQGLNSIQGQLRVQSFYPNPPDTEDHYSRGTALRL
jgi:hypothetical protein